MTPKPSPQPVTNEQFAGLLPANRVSGNLGTEQNRSLDDVVVGKDLFPMGQEGFPVFWRKRRHLAGHSRAGEGRGPDSSRPTRRARLGD